jgi:hypothetical protein
MQRLWQAALLVPIAGGILQTMPSHASLATETVQFQAVNNGATCSFGNVTTPGKLGINNQKNLIGTESVDGLTGGSRASYSVETNFANAKITINTLQPRLNGSIYTSQSNKLFISRNGVAGDIMSENGEATLASIPIGGDTVNIGLTFTPSSQESEPVFEEGSFTAELTATCTD